MHHCVCSKSTCIPVQTPHSLTCCYQPGRTAAPAFLATFSMHLTRLFCTRARQYHQPVNMLQANISTLQTTLQTNTSSPTLDQVTSSNDLPSSDSRVLVQFNSLAASSNSSVLPSDVAAMDAVVNSSYLSNVDTHVITLDNNTANVSDVVTALRARDGTAALSSQYSLTVCSHNTLV